MKFPAGWGESHSENPLLPTQDIITVQAARRGTERLSVPGLRHIQVFSLTPNSLPISLSFCGKATPKVTGATLLK